MRKQRTFIHLLDNPIVNHNGVSLLAVVHATGGAVEGVEHPVHRPQAELRRLEAGEVVSCQAEVAAGSVLGREVKKKTETQNQNLIVRLLLETAELVSEACGALDRLGVDRWAQVLSGRKCLLRKPQDVFITQV
jgi:hypothetical protein